MQGSLRLVDSGGNPLVGREVDLLQARNRARVVTDETGSLSIVGFTSGTIDWLLKDAGRTIAFGDLLLGAAGNDFEVAVLPPTPHQFFFPNRSGERVSIYFGNGSRWFSAGVTDENHPMLAVPPNVDRIRFRAGNRGAVIERPFADEPDSTVVMLTTSRQLVASLWSEDPGPYKVWIAVLSGPPLPEWKREIETGSSFAAFDLEPGLYRVTANDSAGRSASAEVEISANRTSWVSLDLEP